MNVPSDLMQAISTENDINCRMFGRCVHGGKIDSVLGDHVRVQRHGSPDVARECGFARGSLNLGCAARAILPPCAPDERT